MKHMILTAVLLFAVGASAQSLPNSGCSVQASNYLFCSSMGNVSINGTYYAVTSMADITGLYKYPASAPLVSGTVTLQNLATGEYSNNAATGTYSNYVVSLNFSGAFNGSLEFDLVRSFPTPPCGRGCYIPRYLAESVVLTLD